MTCAEGSDALKRAIAGLDELMAESVDEKKEEISKLLVEQQDKGLDSFGRKLKPYKNRKYAEKKHKMNPAPGFGIPDLRLTGETHAGVFVDAQDRSMVMGSSAEVGKVSFLYRHYPTGWDLNQESLSVARVILQPVVIKNLSKQTGFKIVR